MNKESDELEDEFTVSGDGTWKKQGLSSLFGVSLLVAKYCGKVVDALVVSSFCGGYNLWKSKKTSDSVAYDIWYEYHALERSVNHTGDSRKMQVDAIVQMFSRSTEKHGVK